LPVGVADAAALFEVHVFVTVASLGDCNGCEKKEGNKQTHHLIVAMTKLWSSVATIDKKQYQSDRLTQLLLKQPLLLPLRSGTTFFLFRP
jgi:hypothetical protein